MTETTARIRAHQAADTALLAALWLWDKTLGWCVEDSQRRQLREAADRLRAFRRERADDETTAATTAREKDR